MLTQLPFIGLSVALGGGGGGGGFVIAVQGFDQETTTTTQSITTPTLSGITPDATLIIGTLHEPSNDPGETSAIAYSIGVIGDGVNYYVGNGLRDGTTSTVASRYSGDDAAMRALVSLTTNFKAAGVHVSGGFELTYSAADSTQISAMAISFSGSASVGTIPLGNGTSPITETAVGFQPDALIVIGANRQFSTTSNVAPFQFSFGFALSDGTQICVAAREDNSLAQGGPLMTICTDSAAAQLENTPSVSKMVTSNFDTDGFDITPSAGQGSDDLFYIALSGTNFAIAQFTTPTATGPSTITGAGFTPSAAIVVLTNLESVDALGATDDNQGGFAIGLLADDAWAAGYRSDSGAETIDAACQLANVALMGPSATDCDAIKASFVEWTSDGVTLNFSAVQGAAKKGFILFVE